MFSTRHIQYFELVTKSFSLRLRRLALGMFSRDQSPKILRMGLWSTAMTRSLHPRTKYQAFSSASATANRASPSTGAFPDSVALVNLLPTNVIFQPSVQQNGVVFAHSQSILK